MDIDSQFLSKMDFRTRLRHLSFTDYRCLTDSEEYSTPIYTYEELSKEPIKWLKYLLLDRAGVESIEKIKEQIHRFCINDVDVAEAWTAERLNIASDNDRNSTVVGKLVPWDQGAQLKNYRMLSVADVCPAFQDIRRDLVKGAHELWCCESETGASGFNLGGRLNYPRDRSTQILEIVWFTSPRFIENVSLEGFEYPYLRAERSIANPSFSITTLNVPEQYRIKSTIDQWHDDFVAVLWLLASRQLAMQRLVSILHSFGANEVCFCFKVTDGHLTIIDWDTEIESSQPLHRNGDM